MIFSKINSYKMELISIDDNQSVEILSNLDNNFLPVKINSLKFQKSFEKFQQTSSIYIIFQRITKWKVFCNLCWLLSGNSNNQHKGETDDDIESGRINVERGTALTKDHIRNFFGENKDLNSGAVMSSEELESVIHLTDSMFRNACVESSKTCERYTRVFLCMEILTKFADLLFVVLVSLADYLNFSRIQVYICVVILVPIILLQVVSDWGKLLEKYSRLYFEFSDLANSHSETRVKDYENLVDHYRSSWIYADLMPIKRNI